MTIQAEQNAIAVIRKHLMEVATQPSGYFTHFSDGHEAGFKSVVYRVDDNLNYLSCEVTLSTVPSIIELHTATSELVSHIGHGIFKKAVRVPVPAETTSEVNNYFEKEFSKAKYNN